MRSTSVSIAASILVIGAGLALVAFADMASLLPTSDGAYLQWTPSAGSTHYTLVDESSCNGTADYVSTNTTGRRDAYGLNLAGIPNSSTITRIDIVPCASRNKSGGGSSVMNVFYRWNGANSADAGNYSLSGTTPVGLATTSFSGLSLVKSTSSSLQIGAVLTSGTKGARLSRIAAFVTYTVPPPPPPPPPAAPTNLTATPVVTTSTPYMSLQWTDNATNESGFYIERGTDGVVFGQIGTAGANSSAYADFNASSSFTYYYRVRAWNGGGTSAYSNVASGTMP